MLRKRLKNERLLWLAGSALIYLLLVLVTMFIHSFFAQRGGLIALTAIFEPYLFIPFFLFLPLVFVRRTWLLRIALVVACVVFIGRYFLHFPTTTPPTSGTKPITVLTWNALVGNPRDYAINLLLSKQADVMVFQEADWQVVANDEQVQAQYPYHVYGSGPDIPPGMLVLSKYPIQDWGTLNIENDTSHVWDISRVLWVKLDMGAGYSPIVIDAHPISAVNTTPGCTFCTQRRDAQIKEINAFVQTWLKQGAPVLLLGDMNTTDREMAYKDLANGLQDSHLLRGTGSGHSWGIRQFNPYWSLLRIDYIFSSPNIQTLDFKTDCSSRGSDHCVLTGSFAIPKTT